MEQARIEALRGRARVGVITALPKELAAVEAMLEDPVEWTAPGGGAGRRYVLGEVPAVGGGRHVVALALLPDMGNNSAAIRATQLLASFPEIPHLVMCGIAAGVPCFEDPAEHVRLGDVVVSNRNGVIQFDNVKRKAKGKVELRHPPRPPGAELTDAVKHLEVQIIKGLRPWEAFLARGAGLRGAARPADGVNARGEPITHPEDPDREPGLPRIFTGAIGSSNTLLKDATHRDELRARFGLRAVEMDGSGVADAAWASGRAGYLVVRGICDYADDKKGDLWQGYAALAAAAYLRALIASMPAEVGRGAEEGVAFLRDVGGGAPPLPPPPRDPAIEADLAKLEEKIVLRLRDVPHLVEEIARELGLDAAPRPVARALVHERRAEEMIASLNRIDDRFAADPARSAERRAAKRIVWDVLPFAVDWRALICAGREALQRRDRFVELPFRNRTMAEVALAGVDCRSCQYVAAGDDGLPLGGSIVSSPVVARASMSLDGKHAAAATIGLLAMQLLHLAPDDRRICDDDPELRREVDETLEYYASAPGDEYLPRYLLLDDHEIREVRAANAKAAGPDLAVVVTAIGGALPHLRFVRFGKGEKRDRFIALHIRRMWEKGID